MISALRTHWSGRFRQRPLAATAPGIRALVAALPLWWMLAGCSAETEQHAAAAPAPAQPETEEPAHEPGHQHHKHGAANAHLFEMSFEELVVTFDNDDRDSWQEPDKVMETLGDVKDKVVMDLGCGTGYFTFLLAEAGADVIAADVDQRFLDLVQERAAHRRLSERIRTRQVPYHSPSLAPAELDLFLIVNTYHHIEKRTLYFSEVKSGLKPGGQCVVIDYRKEEMEVGPPIEMKLTTEEVRAELEAAGFESIEVIDDLLPLQYIVIAR